MSNPQPTDGLAWIHYVVAQAARAAVGLLGPEIRAMGCGIGDEGVTLHFSASASSDGVREDIEEIAFELDVLLEGHTSIRTYVHTDGSRLDWSQLYPIYEARPEDR